LEECSDQLLKPSLCRDVSRFKNSLKPGFGQPITNN
jgi:hypothetical protein